MCAFATLLSLLTPVRGQTVKQRRDSVSTMREVVVKGTRENTPHQIITRNQINSLPSNSVADALKYLAGVQIKDYGGLGGQKTINVRSLGSQHVGVYLDGVRITNAQNGTVDLGKYSLTTLESVSLYNANKSERLMMATEYASASTVYMRPPARFHSTRVVVPVRLLRYTQAGSHLQLQELGIRGCRLHTLTGQLSIRIPHAIRGHHRHATECRHHLLNLLHPHVS